MSDDIDKSLLSSPYSEQPRSGVRQMLVVGAVIVGILVVVALAWIAVRDDAEPEVVATAASDAGPATSSTMAVPLVALVPYQSVVPMLHHPTVLPVGWEACRVLDDASVGDRFCDPAGADSWVQVSLKYSDQVRADGAQPTGDDERGVWLQFDEYNEAAYARGVGYVVVRDSGEMDADSLLAIATSIPLVTSFGDLYGSPEPRLDLDQISDEQLESLLSYIDPEPRLKRRAGELQIFASDQYLYGFWGDSSNLSEFVYTMPRPRLMFTDRPLLVGENQRRGRGFALWTQGGFVWRVEGQITAEGAAALAADLIQRISGFSTQ